MGRLRERLESGEILLADGATGTNLFAAGLESGDAPELWNVDHPDRVRQLHRSFVAAGADIILTNTFGGNARRLILHDAQDRVRELNLAAVRLARLEADAGEREVLVAGSVGPTGDLFAPLGPMEPDRAREVFRDQMQALADAGADVIWIETMSAVDEMKAAALAATDVGIDHCVTASFDTAGRTMMGVLPGSLGDAVAEHGTLAIGANCGVGAPDLLAAVLDLTADGERYVIAKANCGVPEVRGAEVVYTGTPELMADYVRLCVDTGVRIIGGCCGTTAEHLASMRTALDRHVRGERPDLRSITERLGPMVNSVGAVDPNGRTRRRGRRRSPGERLES